LASAADSPLFVEGTRLVNPSIQASKIALMAVVAIAVGVSRAAADPALGDYLILAGGKVTVGGGSIAAGLVGSSFTGGASERAVTVAGAASVDGDVRSAHHVQLNNGAHVTGTVYHPAGTNISMGAGATVGADVVAPPNLPALPAPSVFASGGMSYTGLGNGVTLTLAPASYGDVILGGACTLNLSAGIYYFNTLRSGNGLDLNLNLGGGSIEIYVTTNAAFGSLDVFLTTGGTVDDIYLEAQGSGSATYNAFSAAGGSDWMGTVFAPNGGIHFGGSSCCSTFQGHFWSGHHVDIEHGVSGAGPPVAATPVPWTVLKSLYR
jgi:hypothetical protein